MFLPELSSTQERVGVLIAIPEPWVSELTEARRALGDAAADKVPSHITLLPPVAVEISEREAVLKSLQRVASASHPFRITLRGTDTFLPVSPVAFVQLAAGGRECVALADEVRTGPLEVPLRFPYHPHVTLAQGLPPHELQAAAAAWQDFEASWIVPGFRLDLVAGDGTYTSRAIFDFAL